MYISDNKIMFLLTCNILQVATHKFFPLSEINVEHFMATLIKDVGKLKLSFEIIF